MSCQLKKISYSLYSDFYSYTPVDSGDFHIGEIIKKAVNLDDTNIYNITFYDKDGFKIGATPVTIFVSDIPRKIRANKDRLSKIEIRVLYR